MKFFFTIFAEVNADKTDLIMKRLLKTSVTVSFLLLLYVAAFGQQNLRTAYFLDGYTYNYKMNPAMAPERSFFSMPAIGNIGAGVETNLKLSSMIYPTGDGVTSFLDDETYMQNFINSLNNVNRLNLSINESLLSFGFRNRESFHTVDLSLKTDISASLPKDIVDFAMTDLDDAAPSWKIPRTGLRANARMELAYGYSFRINPDLRIGARLKMLMGLVHADLLVDNFEFNLSDDEWSMISSGNAQISAPITFGYSEENDLMDFEDTYFYEGEELNEYFSKPSIGLALDLGVTYDFLDYFTASLSVLDLGFISWNSTTTATMPQGRVSYEDFEQIDEDAVDAEEQLSALGDELLNMLKLKKTAEGIVKSNMLSATIHAGIEARMPFYERLTFGLLGTQRIDGIHSWTEGRLIMNLAPINWFSIAGSYAISDFGNSFGAVMNIHLPGFNLYAGLDSFLPLLTSKKHLPIGSLNTNLTLGLTFTFGKAKRHL